ncbi:7005_t:CDS:2 [Acaulospora colombiana]|uniref:7005_t:CDS:1 n=1 Tax=Acaulospora colombiana TaxID=27376 RepID=A0ACA9KSQ8_9GLOM|nr:7005_t:CDS:2 [Acaulospora colombiana]
MTSSHPGYGSTANGDAYDVLKPQPLVLPPAPTLGKSLVVILKSSRINYFLIFVPLGWMAHTLKWNDTWVFILNFLAIIPLSKLYDFATVDVSLRVGQSIGCLLNATFGNAVELIVSIIALSKGEIRGTFYSQQIFNKTTAQTTSSLMTLACIGLVIPAAFSFSVDSSANRIEDQRNIEGLIELSHGTAIVLLLIYILYLYFQLKTHANLYHIEEEEEEAQLSLSVLLFLFIIVTVIVAFLAEYLVGSIEGIVKSSGLSKTFIGIVLLPIIGNAAEFTTAINAATRNKMDFAIRIAAGSSMQIALFITPFLVLFGWTIGQEFTLYFQTFETVVMFISVLITNYLILDGKSNWLEGVMLLATYAIISLSFYYYPYR